MRDHVGDCGESAQELTFQSPDIIVSATAIKDPQEAFGERSRTANCLISGSLTAGSNYFVFVRARNKGGQDASHVEARVYNSPIASLTVPNLWEYVGSTQFPTIRSGDLLTVSASILWTLPGSAAQEVQTTLIALVGNGKEPIPEKPKTWSTLRKLLLSHQFACCNIHSVKHATGTADGDPDAYVRLPFKAPGVPDRALMMHLETAARLPRPSRVWLEMPPAVADLKGIWADPPTKKGSDDAIFVPANPCGRHYFRESLFPAQSEANLALVIYVPPELRKDSYSISVRQVYEDQEVGRVTWRLIPNNRLKNRR